MQAVILAAGMGRRLGEYTREQAKCMVEVNGVRLIDRSLECLSEIGVSRVILVVGYKGEKVRHHVGAHYKGIPVIYVDNPALDKTDNIYSLFLARDFLLEEDTILLESDVMVEKAVLERLAEEPYPDIALVDKFESRMDGIVVRLDGQNHITHFVGRDQVDFSQIKDYYKTVNVYRFSQSFSERYLVPFLVASSEASGNSGYDEPVPKVMDHLYDAPLKALPLSGEKWYRIEDVQDLDIASGLFASSGTTLYKSIASRYGGFWRFPGMLDYFNLVNPYFPTPRMMDEMKAAFDPLVRAYPSGMRVNSLLAARHFGVRQEFITVGNGSAELIKVLVETLNGVWGMLFPSFEEYSHRLEADRVVAYIPTSCGFRYSVKDLIDYFQPQTIDSLVLVNPDNPSGNYIPMQDLLTLIAWTKNRGIRLVVDESFVDFAGAPAPLSLLDDELLAGNPHLVVIKSVSKSYGVPGLRLGVLASGDIELVKKIKVAVSIWNINSFGEFFLQIFEKYHADYVHACEMLRNERHLFREELESIPDIEVFDSQANYLFCRIKSRYSAMELASILAQHDILIKDCSGKRGVNSDQFIRLAVRDRAQNHCLVETLRELFNQTPCA